MPRWVLQEKHAKIRLFDKPTIFAYRRLHVNYVTYGNKHWVEPGLLTRFKKQHLLNLGGWSQIQCSLIFIGADTSL